MKQPYTVTGLRVLNKTGATLPVGTTAEREASPDVGTFRGNSTTRKAEMYVNGRWLILDEGIPYRNTLSANFTVVDTGIYVVDTVGGGVTVTLPVPTVDGERVMLVDATGSWKTNNVIIESAAMINGAATNFILNKNHGSIDLVFTITKGWTVINNNGVYADGEINEWTRITANTNLEAGNGYNVDTSGFRSLALPTTGEDGAVITVFDETGTAHAFDITITSANAGIERTKASVKMDRPFHSITFMGMTISGKYCWIKVEESYSDTSKSLNTVTSTQTLYSPEDIIVPVNTTAGGFTLTLPAAPNSGQEVTVFDRDTSWDKNALIISAGAKTFTNGSGTVKATIPNGAMKFVYNSFVGEWVIAAIATNPETVEGTIDKWETHGAGNTLAPKVNTGYFFAAGSGAATVTLPAVADNGAIIQIVDTGNKADTRPITISGTNMSTPAFVMKDPGQSVTFKRVSGMWIVVANSGSVNEKQFSGRVTANITLTPGDDIIGADSTGGSFTITLPAAPEEGDVVTVYDYGETWKTNTVTINRNGKAIDGTSSNAALVVDGGFKTMVYQTATGWRTVNESAEPKYPNPTRTASFTAEAHGIYEINPGAAMTVTLDPTAVEDEVIVLVDAKGTWHNNNVTVNPGTLKLDGATTDKVYSSKYQRVAFVRTGSGWSTVYEQSFPTAPVSNTVSPSDKGGVAPGLTGSITEWGFQEGASSTLTAVVNKGYNVSTSGTTGGLTVTVPTAASASIGDQIMLADIGGEADEKPITIQSGAYDIAGQKRIRINRAGGMVLLECKWGPVANVKIWMPVVNTGDVKDYAMKAQSADVTVQPNSTVPVTGAMNITLPIKADMQNGDTVTIVEGSFGAIGDNVVTVTAGVGTTIDALTGNSFTIPQELSTITLTWNAHLGNWSLTASSGRVDLASSKLDSGGLRWKKVTSSTLMETNTGYAVTAATGVTMTFPAIAKEGDRILVSDGSGDLSNKPVQFSLNGLNYNSDTVVPQPLFHSFNAREFTYVDAAVGWVEGGLSPTNDAEGIFGNPSATQLLDFTGDIKSYELTLNKDVTISATFTDGLVAAFFIVLKQDAAGGRGVTLPGTWKKADGSPDANTSSGATNVIQGARVNGTVYYSNTIFL